MLLSMPLMTLGNQPGMNHMLSQIVPWLYAIPQQALRLVLLFLTIAGMVWAGGAIYGRAWKALLHRSTNMNTLVALGTGAAFALLPAQNATGNWIKVIQRVPVRIALDQRELAEHPLRVGLSTKVQVDVSNVSGAILAQTVRQTPVLATSAYDIDRQEIQTRIAHIIEENTVEGSGRFAAQPR